MLMLTLMLMLIMCLSQTLFDNCSRSFIDVEHILCAQEKFKKHNAY
jgi:hypothetical protein